MAKSKGFTKYTDDRTPSVTEMISDSDTEAQKRWHEVTYTDASGVSKPYLFEDANFNEFDAWNRAKDSEFKAWREGGEF